MNHVLARQKYSQVKGSEVGRERLNDASRATSKRARGEWASLNSIHTGQGDYVVRVLGERIRRIRTNLLRSEMVQAPMK